MGRQVGPPGPSAQGQPPRWFNPICNKYCKIWIIILKYILNIIFILLLLYIVNSYWLFSVIQNFNDSSVELHYIVFYIRLIRYKLNSRILLGAPQSLERRVYGMYFLLYSANSPETKFGICFFFGPTNYFWLFILDYLAPKPGSLSNGPNPNS